MINRQNQYSNQSASVVTKNLFYPAANMEIFILSQSFLNVISISNILDVNVNKVPLLTLIHKFSKILKGKVKNKHRYVTTLSVHQYNFSSKL